jgi:lysophospholipase L1-like esterase
VRVLYIVSGAMAAAATAVGLTVVMTASPVANAAPAVHYVALGDSYASGDGAGDYISSGGSCNRSKNAYPDQWADANHPASFTFAACANATTATVVSSQLSALSSQTTLVSLTIGGNDVGFTGVMTTCVLWTTSSCLKAVSAAETLVASVLPASLDATLQAIRRDAPNAKIVVVGYTDLYDLSKSSTCIGLSTADRTALNQGADEINSALAAAAARNDDTFASVQSKFAGHEICDSGSWLHSVDIFSLGSSYHPTASGQELGYLPVFTAAAKS